MAIRQLTARLASMTGRWLYPLAKLARRIIPRRGQDVRGLVVDGHGRLLLVEHTYRPGWSLPGGVAEPGEDEEAAVLRELREEVGVTAIVASRRFAVYADPWGRPVTTLFIVEVAGASPELRLAPFEIAAARWVPLAVDSLPEGTTLATRARVREVLGLDPVSPLWVPAGPR